MEHDRQLSSRPAERVPGATININFKEPSGSFRTLVANSLTGSGTTFGMNVDLGNRKGDLLVIQTPTTPPPGQTIEHKLLITNINQGKDLSGNAALLVVKTANISGLAFPSNKVEGGTFNYVTEEGDNAARRRAIRRTGTWSAQTSRTSRSRQGRNPLCRRVRFRLRMIRRRLAG
jgi:pertactin